MGRPRKAEGTIHSELVAIKMHPDLHAHLKRRSEEEYATVADYVRRLVLKDMTDTSQPS